MTIKHLVFSGGGPILFKLLGAIQELERSEYWNINNIENVYGTSAGAIIACIICLKYDWTTLNDYFIKRPWHEAYKFDVQAIFSAYTNKGIFGREVMEILFKPLFDAKDISIDITMKEFYEYSNIKLHIYAYEINKSYIEDISYKTHPDLSLLTAIQMSSAIPIIFMPICIGEKCYIDGGLRSNYPLKYCLNNGANVDEILSFKSVIENNILIDNTTNLLDYMMVFIKNICKQLNYFEDSNMQQNHYIQNEISIINAGTFNVSVIQNALFSSEIRLELIQSGEKIAKDFLEFREKEINISETDIKTI